MARSQWSYRGKIQQDALGKVNRVKEIRRRRNDGLKINRQQLFVRKKVLRAVSVRWRGGRGWEVSLRRRGRSSYGEGGRGLRSCCPTTSEYLGPPGSWLLLEPVPTLDIVYYIANKVNFIIWSDHLQRHRMVKQENIDTGKFSSIVVLLFSFHLSTMD